MTDQDDYENFLIETGVAPAFLDYAMALTDDLIVTPECFAMLEKKSSHIHGQGLFATRDIKAGEIIAPAQRDGKRPVAGRWTNHSGRPNAAIRIDGQGMDMIASRDISAGEEVTVNYRHSVGVNNAMRKSQGQEPVPTTSFLTAAQMASIAKATRLEDAMCELPQAHCPVRELFAQNLYAREITVPAGVTIVGALHLKDSIINVTKGRIQIYANDKVVEVAAPSMFICKAGQKNVLRALEDTVWSNTFQVSATTHEGIMREVIGMAPEELAGGTNNKQVLRQAERTKLESLV